MCEVTTTRLDRGVVLKVMKLDERVIQRWPCRGRWVGLGLRCRHATCAVMGLGRSSTSPSQPSLADYVIIKFRPIEAPLLTASTPTDSDYCIIYHGPHCSCKQPHASSADPCSNVSFHR